MAHTNAAMKPEQCFNLFLVLAMVCGLLADALTNTMVSPVDRASVDEAMGFLAEQLAAIQSLALGDEGQVVSILADAIPQGPRGSRKGTARTILFDIAKGIAQCVPLTKLVLLDFDFCPYLVALLIATLYKAGDTIRVP